jgi:hypothetical protein
MHSSHIFNDKQEYQDVTLTNRIETITFDVFPNILTALGHEGLDMWHAGNK